MRVSLRLRPAGRRILTAAFALLVAAAIPTLAGAGHQPSGVISYTGCLSPPNPGGVVYNLKPGDGPATCRSGHAQIHLSGGDITAIAAGTGLDGGATNGSATLTLQQSYRLPQTCASGQVAKWNGTTAWSCANDESGTGGGDSWKLTGNAGTNPATNFLGTTDNQPLDLRVGGFRALRLERVGDPMVNIVGGSHSNAVTPGVVAATIAGGGDTGGSNFVTDNGGFVGGGSGNRAGDNTGTTSDRPYAAVVGGGFNHAAGAYSFVGGGIANVSSGAGATIGGGGNHEASGLRSTIAGGLFNHATGDLAAIGGGTNNTASATYSTVGGGRDNVARGLGATVAGGQANTAEAEGTVGGGVDNWAGGFGSAVGGGVVNFATGARATIPGGKDNIAAGDNSLAAGSFARIDASHDGTFLWADANEPLEFLSSAANEFAARATGGVRFVTAIDGTGAPTAGAVLPSGGSAWLLLSDRRAKANFAAVDGRAILQRLAGIPVETWNYKSQARSIRHIGPMAQDFYAAFGVGESKRHISTVDADGVAFAAIQGLYAIAQSQATQLHALKKQNASLEARIARLEKSSVRGTAQRRSLGFSVPADWALAGVLFAGVLALRLRRSGGETKPS
jgi:hypothetical protein